MTRKDIRNVDLTAPPSNGGGVSGRSQERRVKVSAGKSHVHETTNANGGFKSGRFAAGVRHIAARDRVGLIKLADR